MIFTFYCMNILNLIRLLSNKGKVRVLFVYFDQSFCNFDINANIVLQYLVDTKQYDISIYDPYRHCTVNSNDISIYNSWNRKFQKNILQKTKFVFCSFFQDIERVISSSYFIANKQYIINIWHGMPVRNIVACDTIEKNLAKNILEYRRKDRIHHVVISKFYQEVFMRSWKCYQEQVHVLGNIRASIILDRSERVLQYLRRIKSDFENYKVLLFCPTHSTRVMVDGSELQLFIYDDYDKLLLSKFLSENNILLLVKTHDGDCNIYDCDAENIIKLDNKQLQSLNITTQSLFQYTNALITDISSIYVDYLLTKKPIICTDVPSDYKRSRSFVLDSIVLDNISSTQKELCHSIMYAITNGVTSEQEDVHNVVYDTELDNTLVLSRIEQVLKSL